MKDLIDERNIREKSQRSIIKSYNVHYMTQEEIQEKEREREEQETMQLINSVLEKDHVHEIGHLVEKERKEAEHTMEQLTEEQIEKLLGES